MNPCRRILAVELISSLICLLGTLSFVLVLHKSPGNFVLALVGIGGVLVYRGALFHDRSTGWLWVWLLWSLQQGLLFLGHGDQLMNLALLNYDGRHAAVCDLLAILLGWMFFAPSLASSEIGSLLAVLAYLTLSVYSLGSRAKGDLELIASSVLYTCLYQCASITLLVNSYSQSSGARRPPSELARVLQALWVLFVPHGIFSALAVLLQLLLSLVFFMLYHHRTPHFEDHRFENEEDKRDD
jgi:hypothetical protein